MRKLWSAIVEALGLLSKPQGKPYYPPAHDVEKFEALRTHINTTGKRVVSVEMFFDGNRDSGSIGCNLSPHPGIETFYDIFKSVEGREDVEQVWMGITDWAASDEMSEWAFCDNVFVIGTFDATEMIALFEPLEPDFMQANEVMTSPDDNEILDELAERFVGLPNRLAAGVKMVNFFWD